MRVRACVPLDIKLQLGNAHGPPSNPHNLKPFFCCRLLHKKPLAVFEEGFNAACRQGARRASVGRRETGCGGALACAFHARQRTALHSLLNVGGRACSPPSASSMQLRFERMVQPQKEKELGYTA